MAINCLKKFFPPYRFIGMQATTIDSRYAISKRLDDTSIKILNWNIAKKNYEPAWTRDFLTIIEQYEPDIICLQEVRMGMRLDKVVGIGEMAWSYAPNFIDAYHNIYSGIMTAAKTSSITRKAIVTQHYEPIIKTPKVSLLTEYKLSSSKETLLTINSHLINFVNLRKFRTELRELEFTISRHRGPIIFSGDFNTWNQSRAILLKELAARLGLTEVSFAPDDSKKIKRFLLSPPLDYIFYRGLREKKPSAKVLDNISSSDHKPMLAEFFYPTCS